MTTRTTGQRRMFGRKELLAQHRKYSAHGHHRKVETHIPFSVLVVNVSWMPIFLANGTYVGTAAPNRGSARSLSKEDHLSLHQDLESNLSSLDIPP